MLWLSTITVSPALKPLAKSTRPWAIAQKFWRFSNLYGEYQAKPPSERRQFILELERCELGE